MSVQIGLLTETPVTKWAAVRPFFVMDVSDVSLQIGADRETAFAKIAFIGLFTGVSAEMPRKISRTRKGFAAVFASVPFHFSRCGL